MEISELGSLRNPYDRGSAWHCLCLYQAKQFAELAAARHRFGRMRRGGFARHLRNRLSNAAARGRDRRGIKPVRRYKLMVGPFAV